MARRLRWGCVSITGNYRENNEDRCLADPQGRFFLVADGMGGQSAGEKASEMAVELVSRRLEQAVDFAHDSPDAVAHKIDDAVHFANGEIMALSELEPSYHNMGTTIALLVQAGEKLLVAGIGDSRVYLCRQGQVRRLTRDHSITEALLEAGAISAEEAVHHRYRNMLYRYLGSKDGGTGAQAQGLDPQPGDRLVLCSDGATDGLSDAKLAQLLADTDDPALAAQHVVSAAEAAGSKDNITCVAVFVDE